MKKDNLIISITVLLFCWTSHSFSIEKISPAIENEGEAGNQKHGYLESMQNEINSFNINDIDPVAIKKVNIKEWRIYSHKKEYLGKLMRSEDNMQLYDKNNKYTGIFLNVNERKTTTSKKTDNTVDYSLSDDFEYVSTRTTSTSITPEEANLYIQVIGAFKKTDEYSLGGDTLLIDKKEANWSLFDVQNNLVGKLEKVDNHFRLFDKNMEFMGSIRESNFRPKGARIGQGTVRNKKRVTSITPEVIKLYLQVLTATEINK